MKETKVGKSTTTEDKKEVLFRWVFEERLPEPVLRARPGTWEELWFSVGCVIRIGGRLWMYYEGSEKYIENSSVGLAFSDDGVTWQRYEDNPIWTKKDFHNFVRDTPCPPVRWRGGVLVLLLGRGRTYRSCALNRRHSLETF